MQSPNVTAVVPLLMVSSMERSLAFYVSGLGFTIENRWIPDGHLRWCWLSLGTAALMLQEATGATVQKLASAGVLGNGVGLNFSCHDALAVFHDVAQRGIHPKREPQVGNFNWEVAFSDPDGYSINFASPTEVPEDTLLSDFERHQARRTDQPQIPTPTPTEN